ncbi:MAG TPA: chemotaxis protein CheW [Thermoanaerobaculia bacterium]|jgi:purine-binding chemotaxis protein CheW
MVDLVKIRKKKAKARAEAEESAAAQESAAVQGSGVVEESRAVERAAAPLEVSVIDEATQAATAPEASTPAIDKLARFKAEAGKRRQTQGADMAAGDTAPAALFELLTFVIAGEQYAVDIERIVEIVTPRSVTRIPNADPSVVGIISLRGTIVTLVDVRRRLHHPPAGAAGVDTRIVVVDFHNETVGFLVDRVQRVVKTARGEVEPPPVVHASELDESVRGVFRAGGALTILLDLDKLLDSRALAATVA